jgi:thiamine-monophosphate kinase
MGDDTAVLPDGCSNLLTTDSLVYGRHFDDELSAELAGAKLLKRSLSDIAAMGGEPGVAVLAGFLPPQTSVPWLERFVNGLAGCAREWGVPLVGGDLTETDGFLGFNLTLTGHAERPILRQAAEVGDLIWVTGELGGSIHGHHARFEPRLKEGAWLAREDAVHTMIDLTDGLAKDLPALLTKGLCASIDTDALPLRASLSTKSRSAALKHAFTDGEDYELLFTTASGWSDSDGPARWEKHFKASLTCIGKVITSPRERAAVVDASTGEALNYGEAYEHFR